MKQQRSTFLFLFLLFFSGAMQAKIVYVKKIASSGWENKPRANVYTNLMNAVRATVSGDQVWVKVTDGSYDLDYIKPGIKMYGGFQGTETAISQRAEKVRTTVRSRDQIVLAEGTYMDGFRIDSKFDYDFSHYWGDIVSEEREIALLATGGTLKNSYVLSARYGGIVGNGNFVNVGGTLRYLALYSEERQNIELNNCAISLSVRIYNNNPSQIIDELNTITINYPKEGSSLSITTQSRDNLYLYNGSPAPYTISVRGGYLELGTVKAVDLDIYRTHLEGGDIEIGPALNDNTPGNFTMGQCTVENKGIHVESCDYLNVTNSTFNNITSETSPYTEPIGINAPASQSVISGCVFDSCSTGVITYGNIYGNTFTNSPLCIELTDESQVYNNRLNGGGIVVEEAGDVVIRNNTIHNAGIGIEVNLEDPLIYNNTITSSDIGIKYMGHSNTFGAETSIAGNLLTHNATAIVLDQVAWGSKRHFNVINNTFFNNDQTLTINASDGVNYMETRFYNNIVWGNSESGAAIAFNLSEAYIGNNVIESGTSEISGDEIYYDDDDFYATNIDQDPVFKNELFNYEIANCSPAKNFGNSGNVPDFLTADLNGDARIQFSSVDPGAHESSVDNISISSVVAESPVCYGTKANVSLQLTGRSSLATAVSTDGGKTWNTKLPSLPAGSYNIVVRDGTCELPYSANPVIIKSVKEITYTTTVKNSESCDPSIKDGSITITPETGTEPFEFSIDGGLTYSGNNEFTKLALGTYSLAVKDANGCTAISEVTIGSNKADVEIVDLKIENQKYCNGSSNSSGSITVNVVADGGQGEGEFSIDEIHWYPAKNTISDLDAGEYNLYLRPRGGNCYIAYENNPVVIELEDEIYISRFSTVNNITCENINNGTIEMELSGGAGNTELEISADIINIDTKEHFYAGIRGGGVMSFDNLPFGSYKIVEVIEENIAVCTLPIDIENTDVVYDYATPITAIDVTPAESCPGSNSGTIEITANTSVDIYVNGAAQHDYAASHTLSDMGAGKYQIKTKEEASGCISVYADSVEVALINELAIVSYTDRDGGIFFELSGSGNYSVRAKEQSVADWDGISWENSNQIMGLPSGHYQFQIIDQAHQMCMLTFPEDGSFHTVTNTDLNFIITDVTATNLSICSASDGTIEIAVQGDGTYEYRISSVDEYATTNQFSGLEAGIYYIEVRDEFGNSQEYPQNPVIIGNGIALGNIVAQDASCYTCSDGAIEVAMEEGTAPFQIKLNDGDFIESLSVGSLPQGAYTVTVQDANGCQAVAENIIVSHERSSKNSIISYAVEGQIGTSVIDAEAYTVSLQLYNDFDIGNITPQITISEHAEISPESGASISLAENVIYTVEAENGDVKEWTVSAERIENAKPVVSADVPEKMTEGETYALDASASYDPEGGELSYNWKSNGGTFSVSEEADVSFTPNSVSENTEVSIVITCTDEKNASVAQEFKVLVENAAVAIDNISTERKCGGADGDGTIAIETTPTEDVFYTIDGGNRWTTESVFKSLKDGQYSVAVQYKDYTSPFRTVVLSDFAIDSIRTTAVSAIDAKDGSVEAFVSGGSGTYLYVLEKVEQESSFFSDVPAGDYAFVAVDKDMSCELKTSVSVPLPSYTVSFTVTDKTVPLQDATVTCNKEQTVTDQNGAATFASVEIGDHEFTVSKTGYTTVSGTITVKDVDVSEIVTLKESIQALTGTVAISGILQYGEELTASVTGTNNSGTLSYQWKRNDANISGATAETYTLAEADITAAISVIVTSSVETGSIASQATTAIEKADKAAPVVPEVASKTHNTITLTVVDGCEYQITGRDMQSSPIFTGLMPESDYNLYQRYAETATHKASPTSQIAVQTEAEPIVYSVTFTITDGTSPIEGASVQLEQTGTQQSDENGQVNFANLFSTTYQYWIEMDGYVSHRDYILIEGAEIVSITMIETASDDATLSSLKIDGREVDGFISGVTNYTKTYPYCAESTIARYVTATSSNDDAQVEVTQVSSGNPNSATVLVTAADGETKKLYTINFAETTPVSIESVTPIDATCIGRRNAKGGFEISAKGGNGTLEYGYYTTDEVNIVEDVKLEEPLEDGSENDAFQKWTIKSVYRELPKANYQISVRDEDGCEEVWNNGETETFAEPEVIASAEKTDISASGVADGTITVTASVESTIETASFNYALVLGTITDVEQVTEDDVVVDVQASNVFNGLASGEYTVVVFTSLSNCEGEEYTLIPIEISAPVVILTGTVTISGTLQYGEELTASVTETNNTGTFSYQWKRNGVAITGATAEGYVLTEADIAATISVSVTSSEQDGSVSCKETSAIAKANQDAPAVPALEHSAPNSVTLVFVEGCEYAIDGGQWQTSPEFTGLDADTEYSFAQRYAETGRHNASEASASVEFKTSETPRYTVNFIVTDGTSEIKDADVVINELTVQVAGATSFNLVAGGEFTYTVSASAYYGADGSFTMPSQDTTITFLLLPKYEVINELVESACGEYAFGKELLTVSGQYADTVKGDNSFEITQLALTVHPAYVVNASKKVEFGKTYQFGTQTLSKTGVYTEKFASVSGCDSTVTLAFKVLPRFIYTEEEAVSCGDYTWEGRKYTESGTYSASYTSVDGVDSIIDLHLTVYPLYSVEREAEIAFGSSYEFGSQILTKTGVYTERFESVHGCDSTVTLTLTVLAPEPVFDTVWADACGMYEFGGKEFVASGQYIDTLLAVSGGDSIVVLNLSVYPLYAVEREAEIAFGNNYEFGSQILSKTGVYTERFESAHGCDSTVTLTLTVLVPEPVFDTVWADACGMYEFGGEKLVASGQYLDTLYATNGGDSIVVLNLVVYQEFAVDAVAEVFAGETFLFGDTLLAESGTYTRTFESEHGCDSTVTLLFTVAGQNAVYDSIAEEACGGYVFADSLITKSGEYRDTLLSATGADSIVVLSLTIYPTYTVADTVSVPFGGHYQFGSELLTQSGSYTHAFQSATGCDSTINLVLVVLPDDVVNSGDLLVLTIEENPAAGTPIASLPETSADGTVLEYTLSDTKYFAIEDGAVVVSDPSGFDAEAGTELSVVVYIKDGDNTDTAELTVALSGVNEMPEIETAGMAIAENPDSLAVIATLPATDQDGDTLSYALVDSSVATLVCIELVVADPVAFDAEKGAVTVELIVSDGVFTDTISVKIAVENINEFAPEIADMPTTYTIAENSANGTVVATVAATDADGDSVSIFLEGAGSAFAIDKASGVISVTDQSALDYETVQSFTLAIVASDGEKTATSDIVINLTDIDEGPIAVVDKQEISIVVYPTVVSEMCTVDVGGADGAVEVYSAGGVLAYSSYFVGAEYIDFTAYANGVYYVFVTAGGQRICTKVVAE